MKRKLLAVMMTAAMVMSLVACGNSTEQAQPAAAETAETTEAATAETEAATAEEAQPAAEGSYTIGISQFAEHGSLDNCREGFLEGLKEAGIEEGVNLTVLFDNAQADMGTASTISNS